MKRSYRLKSMTRWIAPVMALVLAFVGLRSAAVPVFPWTIKAAFAAIGVVGLALAARTVFGGLIVFDGEMMIIRGSIRTRRFRIEDVDHLVIAGPLGSPVAVDSERLLVVLQDGRTWRPADFASTRASRGKPGSVGWIVAHVNADLAAIRNERRPYSNFAVRASDERA